MNQVRWVKARPDRRRKPPVRRRDISFVQISALVMICSCVRVLCHLPQPLVLNADAAADAAAGVGKQYDVHANAISDADVSTNANNNAKTNVGAEVGQFAQTGGY